MKSTIYAFPMGTSFTQSAFGGNIAGNSPTQGMTLRDYFAAKALQGILADTQSDPDIKDSDSYSAAWKNWADELAAASYEIADSMLKARGEL